MQSALWGERSVQDALDFIERNLILPLVIELSRPGRLVVGDVLRDFPMP